MERQNNMTHSVPPSELRFELEKKFSTVTVRYSGHPARTPGTRRGQFCICAPFWLKFCTEPQNNMKNSVPPLELRFELQKQFRPSPCATLGARRARRAPVAGHFAFALRLG
jgi:hypothetical protein